MTVAVTFRTTDLVRWGVGTGVDLDADQIDSNFWEVKDAIETLQTAMPGASVNIDYFAVSGSEFYVHMTDHSVLGPYALPTVVWVFKGAWTAATAYVYGDVITINGATYWVLVAHTSAGSFDPNANDGLGHNYYALLLDQPAASIPAGGTTGQVLTKSSNVDFETSWQNPTENPIVLNVVTVATSTYTLLASHAGSYIRFTNVAGCLITVPQASTLSAPAGAFWNLRGVLGPLVIEGDSGLVLINGIEGCIDASDRYGATLTLQMYATDSFDLMGLVAVHA